MGLPIFETAELLQEAGIPCWGRPNPLPGPQSGQP